MQRSAGTSRTGGHVGREEPEEVFVLSPSLVQFVALRPRQRQQRCGQEWRRRRSQPRRRVRRRLHRWLRGQWLRGRWLHRRLWSPRQWLRGRSTGLWAPCAGLRGPCARLRGPCAGLGPRVHWHAGDLCATALRLGVLRAQRVLPCRGRAAGIRQRRSCRHCGRGSRHPCRRGDGGASLQRPDPRASRWRAEVAPGLLHVSLELLQLLHGSLPELCPHPPHVVDEELGADPLERTAEVCARSEQAVLVVHGLLL
mmetsp:Transcript_9997/g.29850  ORF Transcript_9997/g.29850 Transcript_9997/m.29850 type:complete len:254 (+) Transcript_9997:1140-1901(+)